MSNLSGQYVETIAIPFVIAILALAFPLMLDASSKISGQYKSPIMAKSFQGEFSYKAFIFLIVLSIVAIVVYTLKIPVQDCFDNCWLISNSAVLLVYVSTVLLVISLLYLARMISIYYSQGTLMNHLSRRYNQKVKLCNKQNRNDFLAISKLMNYSIENSDEDLARSIFTFFSNAFVSFRVNKENQEIIYPEDYYNTVFDASELLCMRQRKTVSYFNDGTLYEFFIDSYQGTKVSKKTLRFMWMCVIQNISYNKDEYTFSLWKKLFQHVGLFLHNNNMDEEKQRYIEFAHVICAYLLYSKHFSLIPRMLSYTQMQPADYVLTPSSTQGVIDACILALEHNEYGSPSFPVYWESLYPFPGVDGVDAEGVIEKHIIGFYALSFLWQYTVEPTFQVAGYSDDIYSGQDIDRKKKTLEALHRLDFSVKQICDNPSLLSAIHLENVEYGSSFSGHKSPKQWFIDNILSIKTEIEDQNEIFERNAQIPDELVINYKNRVYESWSDLFEDTKSCFSNSNKKKKNKSYRFLGRHDVEQKSHVLQSLNFQEVFGNLSANDFRTNMWLPFLSMKVSRYLLEEKDALEVAFRWKKRKGLIIFNFGIWFNEQQYIDNGLLARRGNDLFTKGDIPIISINTFPIHPALIYSLLIIKQNDLPFLKIDDVEQSLKDELGLEPCSDDSKVYTSVIDFHQDQWSALKSKYCVGHKGNEDKYAMFSTAMNISLNYDSNAPVIFLKVYNQFEDRSAPQRPDEVVDIWKKNNSKEES